MPAIQARELRDRIKSKGLRETMQHLGEALEQKHLQASDFSVRDLAENLVPDGREWVNSLNPRHGGYVPVTESDGVDVTAFANIIGQILYSKIMEAYEAPEFLFSRLIPNVPTQFDGEKIPGVARLADNADVVHPGMPYESYGFGEEYIETPSTTKRGFIVPVTKEAVFFDRTGLVLQRAAEVGTALGLNKEKRLVDLVIGATNNYKRNGTTYNTYQTSTPWINDQANELVDWTDVDNARLLFSGMSDPNTSEPIMVTGGTMVVAPGKAATAFRVVNATEIRFGDGASNTTQTISASPVSGFVQAPVESELMYRRLQSELSVSAANSAKYWFVGDFKKAFAYMENWPITVVQAPAGNEDEFNRDIVYKAKASERGAAAAINPRYVIRNTN